MMRTRKVLKKVVGKFKEYRDVSKRNKRAQAYLNKRAKEKAIAAKKSKRVKRLATTGGVVGVAGASYYAGRRSKTRKRGPYGRYQ